MTTEQQIEQACKAHQFRSKNETFKAGASFYEEMILPGMMVEFAEWVDAMGWIKTTSGHWSDYNDNHCALEQVITKFLSHLKHNQDATQ